MFNQDSREGLMEMLARQNEKLSNVQQANYAAQAHAAAQIAKLADNNASLARTNNRLINQLEKLRRQHESLAHLTTGQQAVARAKETELAGQIKELKQLLKDSHAERETLHAQLLAKQEVVRYLEWRLAQVQQIVESHELLAATTHPAKLSNAFDAAAKAAAGELPLDSFSIMPDSSSEQSIQASRSSPYVLPRTLHPLGRGGAAGTPSTPAGTHRPQEADSNKENAGPAATNLALHFEAVETSTHPNRVPIRNEETSALLAHDTPLLVRRSLRTPLASITPTLIPALEEAGGRRDEQDLLEQSVDSPEDDDVGLPGDVCPERGAESLAELRARDDALRDKPTPEKRADTGVTVTPVQICAFSSEDDVRDTPNDDSHALRTDGHGAAAAQGSTALATPEIQNPAAAAPTASTDLSTPALATVLRSSSRARRVSYALPTLNSKLRQGDRFTFGDPAAVVGKSKAKKTPSSRTKPRPKHSGGPWRKHGGSLKARLPRGAAAPVATLPEDSNNDGASDT